MNSHEMRVDVWSRALLAAALLLLLINQVQLASRASDSPGALIPSATSALRDVSRYPQPMPAWDNPRQSWSVPAPQAPAVASRQGSWVF